MGTISTMIVDTWPGWWTDHHGCIPLLMTRGVHEGITCQTLIEGIASSLQDVVLGQDPSFIDPAMIGRGSTVVGLLSITSLDSTECIVFGGGGEGRCDPPSSTQHQVKDGVDTRLYLSRLREVGPLGLITPSIFGALLLHPGQGRRYNTKTAVTLQNQRLLWICTPDSR